MLSVAEDDGTVQVCASLSTVNDTNITITLVSKDGTGAREIRQHDSITMASTHCSKGWD